MNWFSFMKRNFIAGLVFLALVSTAGAMQVAPSFSLATGLIPGLI